MLYPANGRNRYCGPGALAILTGASTDATAKWLRHVNGLRAVRGVYQREILAVLGPMAGEELRFKQRAMTVRRFCFEHPTGRWLVRVNGHLFVVENSMVCDNRTVYPLPVERFHGRRCFVTHAWKIHD